MLRRIQRWEFCGLNLLPLEAPRDAGYLCRSETKYGDSWTERLFMFQFNKEVKNAHTKVLLRGALRL